MEWEEIEQNRKQTAYSKSTGFYLPVQVYGLSREIKCIFYSESQSNKKHGSNLSNQWECSLEFPFLTGTKGFLHTFKLRTTAEVYLEPLKDDKQSSEIIHSGFKTVYLDAEYKLIGGWSRIEAGTQV